MKRALKFQSLVPIRFCGNCVRTTSYLINKLPTRVLQSKCPYEMLDSKLAKIDHFPSEAPPVVTYDHLPEQIVHSPRDEAKF